MKIKLNPSLVVFTEEDHKYMLEDKRLVGITGLIHKMLGLGVYPESETNDYVKDIAIPRAGSKGTAVHHAIQTYDVFGIKQTTQIVPTTYGCEERNNLNYVDEEWEVGSQLEAYIRNLENGFEPIANEYTVSDNEWYASQIDNVWRKMDTQGIWLVDTKTNNLNYYPTCGYFQDKYFQTSTDALKEYLSWQLSIYAELFEAQNPDLKVEGLACNWLRDDNSAFWEIGRKPKDKVLDLLQTRYRFDEDGECVFIPRLFSWLNPSLPTINKDNSRQVIVPEDVINLVYTIQKQYQEAEAKLNEMKPLLRKAMEENGIKSWDSGLFKATIAADSCTSSFDTKKFKEDHPELYKQYLVEKFRKGGFSIRI